MRLFEAAEPCSGYYVGQRFPVYWRGTESRPILPCLYARRWRDREGDLPLLHLRDGDVVDVVTYADGVLTVRDLRSGIVGILDSEESAGTIDGGVPLVRGPAFRLR